MARLPGQQTGAFYFCFDDVKRQEDRLVPVKVWELKCNQAVSSAGLVPGKSETDLATWFHGFFT